tara:strand:+ start:1192 stop:2292 length:1101 start_codon:yes stop_codon:yes gene_type:complete
MYDLTKHFLADKKQILSKIESVLNRGILEMGEEVEQFEENFKKYCDVKYCVTVSSGSMGLLLALKSFNLNKNDEVITVSNSDIPTSHAISLVGAKIRWIDIKANTLNIDEDIIEKNINKNTKVILPVHMFGNPCKMSKIKSIAKKFKLKVVEDACLATGAEYENKKIGSLSDCSVFSTNPGKILDGIGPGGIITTNNKDLYYKLLQLRDYGRRERPKKWPVKSYMVGYNSKMSTINAAVLNIRLKKLNEYIDLRNRNAEIYKEILFSKKIKFQHTLHEAKSAWRNFTIRVKNRNKVFDKLNSINPLVKLSYIPPNHQDKCYKNLKYNYDLKITEKISSEIINLPCHQYMTPNNIKDLSRNVLRLIK